ncbi:MAG: PTS system mannose/fructose/sorbose family transporter subunit IID, partial [Staphylococcus equorum]|nr:PTS system mannose/fructose/sorbose family transporter subunit IID [Staphylococcus equorum]
MDIKLTRKELIKNWALTYSSETAYNYERLQALGQANAMVPVIRKLYSDDKERQVKELKKYFVFYNTEPSFIGTMIPGVAAAMEEQRANGAEDITDETINSLRTGLMGPVAGIGDTVSQGIVYPILAGIACSLAIDGSYVGPIFFEIAYKVLLIGFGWNMYRLGYQKGKTFILTMLKEGTISRLTEIFSMIGLMVVGCMTAERVDIESPFILNIRGVELNIQEDVLDALMPGLIPLGITMFVYW